MKIPLLSIMVALLIEVNAPAQSTSTLPDYLTSYMQLKDALYSSDVAKAKTAAIDMKNKLSNVDKPGK